MPALVAGVDAEQKNPSSALAKSLEFAYDETA
jgi:hypothetical protein